MRSPTIPDRPRTVRGLLTTLLAGALALGCSGDMNESPPEPADPVIIAKILTEGVDLDLNGYTLTLDGAAVQQVDVNATRQIETMPGHHTLTLSGLANNCTMSDSSSWARDSCEGRLRYRCVSRDVRNAASRVHQLNRTGTFHVWAMNRDGNEPASS